MEFIFGNEKILDGMQAKAGLNPFSKETVDFCDAVAKELMHSPEGRSFPDIITLGFWLRKSSVLAMKKRFLQEDEKELRFGRGLIFHIAPSNVPVNFAYSLFAGLLCGNANIVKVPSKDFPQVSIITDVLRMVTNSGFSEFAERICLVRYGHEKDINDRLSSLCNVRVIWGGDNTIREIKRSPLPPRSTEVAFADRFSLAVIDTKAYSCMEDKAKDQLARGFYNDTYLTDQNACTSPRLVVWRTCGGTDGRTQTEDFWRRLWKIVDKEYVFQDIQAVNKLTKAYLLAQKADAEMIKRQGVDNRMIRVKIRGSLEELEPEYLRQCFESAGYFLEYHTDDLMELRCLCNDIHCQTIGYVGESNMLKELVSSGVHGVDRVVPVGKTMDFDMIWDGYDLVDRFTRVIAVL